jgi:hypothetical protein
MGKPVLQWDTKLGNGQIRRNRPIADIARGRKPQSLRGFQYAFWNGAGIPRFARE